MPLFLRISLISLGALAAVFLAVLLWRAVPWVYDGLRGAYRTWRRVRNGG